jgi:hypothetical protein
MQTIVTLARDCRRIRIFDLRGDRPERSAHHEWLVSDKKVGGRAVFTDSMTTFDPDQSFDWAHCGLDQPCLAVDT